MSAIVIAFPPPEREAILRDAREIALNTDAPKNARRDACAMLNAYGDWRDHMTAREIMATLNAIQGGDISNEGQRLARDVQDFRPLTDAERRSIGIDGDDPVHVWGMGENFAAMNAPTMRSDRMTEARPYVMGALVALGVLIGLGVAIGLASVVLAGDTAARLSVTLAQAEAMEGM